MLCAVAGIIALMGQPLLVFAATPPTAAGVSNAPNSNPAAVNTANNKIKMPSLSVTFNTASAKNGDIVTALAVPVGFAYDDNALYYTWYIRHKNGSNDPNDWKVEAAKIMARGNFDPSTADYSKQIFADADKGYMAWPEWQIGKDQDKNCYLQDYKTGRIWEVSSSSKGGFNCPSNASAKCVKTQQLTIPQADCADDAGGATTNVCLEGADPTCSATNTTNYASAISCAAGYAPMCILNGASVFPDTATNADVCSVFNTNKGNAAGLTCDDPSVSTYTVESDGTTPTTTTDNQGNVTNTDNVQCARVRTSNDCQHLFPDIGTGTLGDGKYTLGEEQAWKTNPAAKSTAGNGNNDEMNLVGLNNNKFTWTYQEGDEVGVAVEGLSQQGTQHNDASRMITWAFSKNVCPAFSDAITNDPTDARYYVESQGNSRTGSLGILNFHSSSFSLDDCLKDNLIDPAVAGIGNLDVSLAYDPQNPVNVPPVTTDPTAGPNKGDVVTVTSDVGNVTDASTYYYKWSIEGRNSNAGMENIDDNGWQDITSKFDDHTPLEGIGLSTLSFKMDLANLIDKDTPKYIRVKLNVQESNDGSGASRTGSANVVIPVTLQATNIEAYGVNVVNGVPVMDKSIVICGENEEPCTVAKNEIVAAVLPNDDPKNTFSQFSWKFNTDDLPCPGNIPECKNNVVFFPVVGEEGDSININLTAKAGEAGKTQTFSKLFDIVAPSVQITPADANSSFKTLGSSTDLSGNVTPQYSSSVIEASADSDVMLKAVFSPTFIEKNTTYAWTVDGQTVSSNADSTISLHSGDPDTVNNIDLAGTYVQPIEVRKALQDIWGVDASDSQDSDLQDSVQVEIPDAAASANPGTDSGIPMGAMGSPSRFFASLITDMPSQLMFFTRIGLTMALLLLAVGVLFSVIPGAAESERRRI